MMVAVFGRDQSVRDMLLPTRAVQTLVWFVCVWGFVIFAAEHPTEPSASLTPAEVVAAQLDALKGNESSNQDAGIRITFGFASPQNQSATGPVERFIELVKNPVYSALLNHRSVRFSEMMVVADSARQKVTLTDRDGRQATFVFILSKQAGPPCDGCWMTDAVIRSENHVPSPRIALLGLGDDGWRGLQAGTWGLAFPVCDSIARWS